MKLVQAAGHDSILRQARPTMYNSILRLVAAARAGSRIPGGIGFVVKLLQHPPSQVSSPPVRPPQEGS